MGFKLYEIKPSEDGAVMLVAGMALRFSGPDGVIALWTKSHRDRAERPWQVPPEELVRVLGLGVDPSGYWIVFEQTDEEESRRRFARLVSVSGVCARGKTDILLALEPLLTVTDAADPVVKREPVPRLWSEELVLEGEPGMPRATWTWSKPHLQLGSATVGGSARAR